MISQFLNSVSQFHALMKYRQPEPETPDLTDAATNKLRPELIREELRETHQAWLQGNRVEMLDGLCDLQYVLSGAILAWGFRPFFSTQRAVPPADDVESAFVQMFGWNEQLEIAARKQDYGQVLNLLSHMQDMLLRMAWSFELMSVFEAAFEAVHANNMAKVWSLDESYEWNTSPKSDSWVELNFEPTEGGFIARRSDGKIVKPIRHRKVDLSAFIK